MFLGEMLSAANAAKETFLPAAQDAGAMIEGGGNHRLDAVRRAPGENDLLPSQTALPINLSAIAAAEARSASWSLLKSPHNLASLSAVLGSSGAVIAQPPATRCRFPIAVSAYRR